ncbi:MAG: ABC transporter ATP-binding protein [Deltaproteobacteria bacterium]|jgi:iron complex transport system ATP-binding protein|nr:ABC transporter ATP-binding protein [Deltaproteobacteria bacterium]
MSLIINDLCFGYSKKPPILKNLEIVIPKGQVTALLGANGAGKTTLLRLILGLLAPRRGTIFFNDIELNHLTAAQRARFMAYVPQFSELILPNSVAEIVLASRFSQLGLGRAPKKADWAAVNEALELTGLLPLANRPFVELSGGEKRKVLIARALAQQSELLVLDEPAANLDPVSRLDCLKTIRSLAQGSQGALMTTHFPDQALLVSDRVVLIKDGVVFAQGASETVLTAQNLSAIYDRPFEVIETKKLSDGRTYKVCLPLWGEK